MLRILGYLKPHAWRVALGLTLKSLGAFSELFLPWILTYIIDEIIPLGSMPRVLLWGGVMVLFSVICVVTNITSNRVASSVARDAVRQVRHDLFHKTTYLSCSQMDRVGIPSLVSRMTTDTYNVHRMFGMVQRLGVRAPLLLLGGICLTLTLDVPLTLIMMGVLPFIGATVYTVSKKGLPHFKRLQTSIDGLVRVVRENVTGARIIKALCKTDFEDDRFKRQSREVADNEAVANIVMGLNQPIMNILLNGGMILVIIVGAYRVNLGLATPANIIAFLSYFTIIANAMMGVTRLFIMFSRTSASASRIVEIMDLPEELLPEEAESGDPAYHVEFDGVTFSYNKRRPTLENLSFKLKKGERLGLIGPTGSGKSTLIALLLRFYDADAGKICVEGKNIRSWDPGLLRKKFGVVFQNDAVFADSLRENVDFGRDVTDEDFRRALHDAQAAEFVAGLENGLDEHLNSQATNLSGGQRQRLLITRALAGKPDILVLDDSSSALDFKTDANLRKALQQNWSDTTTVIVASRVSSIAHCNQIIMLDAGKVIGQGTHAELMENCPQYRAIAELQMGGMKA